jgi:hypothetical protein
MLKVLDFTISRALGPFHPFDHALQVDPHVVYHGTSASSEASIEREGFIPGRPRFTREELVALREVFTSLRWAGLTARSLAVLGPFCIDHDLAPGQTRPVFFAETPWRASLYASLDFAGGEAARTVRSCFDELRAYRDDEAVRASHRARVEREIRDAEAGGWIPPPPLPPFDPEELGDRLLALAPVEHTARALLDGFTHGLIYAVRLEPEALRVMSHGQMGLAAHAPIRPERIVGKARVSREYEWDFFAADGNATFERYLALRALTGSGAAAP